MAGFRKSGAFPLNPGEVTDRHIAPSKGVLRKEASPQVTAVSTSSPPASLALSPRSSCSFTSEQHELYQRRYAEGFDLPDPDYQRWVEMHHAEEIRSAESLVTHASGASIEERNSDALSDILSLPEPANDTRRRRRRALNSTAVTDLLSYLPSNLPIPPFSELLYFPPLLPWIYNVHVLYSRKFLNDGNCCIPP